MSTHNIGCCTECSNYFSVASARSRCGYTLIELLIVATIIAAFLATGAALMTAAGNAYDDLVWQPRVDQEAQQALDDICDTLRLAGDPHDLLGQMRSLGQQQVAIPSGSASSASMLKSYNIAGTPFNYQVRQSPTTGVRYLTRQYLTSGNTGPIYSVAMFTVTVNFEYEYREVAQPTDAFWKFSRLSDLAEWNGTTTSPVYLIDIVYITVSVQAVPYPGGPQYQRTLRSAVHLRAPFNTTLPPAVAG